MTTNRTRMTILLLIIVATLGVWFGLLADSSFAQCVMCRASLTNNSAFAKNLNLGVLVLLVPPVSIFCTIFILAIRNRKS